MKLNQKQFSEFVTEQVKKSGMKQKEIAHKLDHSQPAISNALKKSDHENSRYNGTRKDILNLLGYVTENLIRVEKRL
ncbi:hypothetical protein KAR91_06670 [Candidatus Pacearchaeota archaeon]|nr:hypothetical protein [Candidatus Pacearchaeota archaeon]